MREKVWLGNAPYNEKSEAAGMPDYDPQLARAECRQYIEAIRKKCGPEPDGARLRIITEQHDSAGSYLEVVCEYDVDNQQAAEYAYRVDESTPSTWAEVDMVAPNVKKRGV